MHKKSKTKRSLPLYSLEKIFLVLTLLLFGILLFFGGLGVEVEMVQYVEALVGVLLVILAWPWKGKIKLPPFITLYLLFR